MSLRSRDVRVTMRQKENDQGEKRYYIRLTYKPTGVEVDGEGGDLDVLRSDLQGQLEELVGLEEVAEEKPDNVLEFPANKWQGDPTDQA